MPVSAGWSTRSRRSPATAARARRRHRRHRLPRRRADPARRHADHLRPRARDARAPPSAAPSELGIDERALPPDRRRVDRPAGRQPRRRAVPLGLHADGRRRGRAARDTRRVLRPGGRVALAAWGDPGRQPVERRCPCKELVARGLVEPPPPGAPGQFAWAPEGAIAETLDAAGFVEYEVESVPFTMRYPSVDDWWQASNDMSLRVLEAREPCAGRAEIVATRSASGPRRLDGRGRLAGAPRAGRGWPRRPRRPPRPMFYDNDADLACSTARPSPSSATARRATPTRSTSRTPASTSSSACAPTRPPSSRPARAASRSPTSPTPPRAATS